MSGNQTENMEKISVTQCECARLSTVTGFTLIETIIYVALFAVLVVGMLASTGPIFDGIERMSARVMTENEVTVVTRTITSLLPQSTSVSVSATSPQKLTIVSPLGPPGGITYVFWVEGGAVVSTVTASGVTTPFTLTASRVIFDSMSIVDTPAVDTTQRYISILYTVDGTTYGPIRSYLSM